MSTMLIRPLLAQRADQKLGCNGTTRPPIRLYHLSPDKSMPGVSMPIFKEVVLLKKYKYSKDITFEGRRYKIRADTEKELIRKEILKFQELENGVLSSVCNIA